MPLSAPPKITSVEAFPVRLPRDPAETTGTAGTPTTLGQAAGAYRWSAVYPALYSEFIETALVKVTLDNGLHGWGEAQAPLAPRVACTIVADLLAPVLEGIHFDGRRHTIAALWSRMFQTMRVRGQTGGFMLDAISGVDLALWDLAGKLQNQPAARMIAGKDASNLAPCYLSGVCGRDQAQRTNFVQQHFDQGFRAFKIFHGAGNKELVGQIDALKRTLDDSAKIAVDALWRLDLPRDEQLLRELEARRLLWLECPFNPDEIEPHRQLGQYYDIPLAVGESYRTRWELEPFFTGRLIRFVQPDLGRSGLTETLRIARLAAESGVAMVPHVSLALGPQIGAAVHAAAAIPNCTLCEYNPNVFGPANRYLVEPLLMENACYRVPSRPGLGADLRMADLQKSILGF